MVYWYYRTRAQKEFSFLAASSQQFRIIDFFSRSRRFCQKLPSVIVLCNLGSFTILKDRTDRSQFCPNSYKFTLFLLPGN